MPLSVRSRDKLHKFGMLCSFFFLERELGRGVQNRKGIMQCHCERAQPCAHELCSAGLDACF